MCWNTFFLYRRKSVFLFFVPSPFFFLLQKCPPSCVIPNSVRLYLTGIFSRFHAFMLQAYLPFSSGKLLEWSTEVHPLNLKTNWHEQTQHSYWTVDEHCRMNIGSSSGVNIIQCIWIVGEGGWASEYLAWGTSSPKILDVFTHWITNWKNKITKYHKRCTVFCLLAPFCPYIQTP